MKILHINSYYSKSEFYKNLIDGLNNTSINHVYVPVSKKFIIPEFNYGEYSKVVKCYNPMDRYFFYPKEYKILRNIKENYSLKDYDLIHAHSLFSNGYIAYKLNKIYKTPYIVAVRNTDVNTFFKKIFFLRKLGLNILLNASKIIFISHSYKEHVLSKYIPKKHIKKIDEKSTIVSNGIDDFWFIKKKEMHNIKMHNLKLLQVGDINKNKNIVTTLKVVKILNRRGVKCSLTSVGKIKDKKIYERIKDNNYLNYLGFLSNDKLVKVYSDHDIFILPSINETFGLVYAEAMSQGLPVIYTKDQGFDKQFSEGTIGYAINPYSVEEIANKVILILNKYNEISQNCKLYSNKFSWSNIVEKYNILYSQVT